MWIFVQCFRFVVWFSLNWFCMLFFVFNIIIKSVMFSGTCSTMWPKLQIYFAIKMTLDWMDSISILLLCVFFSSFFIIFVFVLFCLFCFIQYSISHCMSWIVLCRIYKILIYLSPFIIIHCIQALSF